MTHYHIYIAIDAFFSTLSYRRTHSWTFASHYGFMIASIIVPAIQMADICPQTYGHAIADIFACVILYNLYVYCVGM